MKKLILLLLLTACNFAPTKGETCLKENIGTRTSCWRGNCTQEPTHVCIETLLWYVPGGFHEGTITGCYGKIYKDGMSWYDLKDATNNLGFKKIECSLIRTVSEVIE